ncbi:hypothetical protein SARC_05109 [Sphaeroforma arctica JP610]|uniref:N(4)-(Beta-N-acetylglucosaminyl)-L-asparaginase n=1 Tax=Sphaeroforma arctica JP610 TaxID=667725 RepID=A0A0L0G0I5_9EUKA|nr:hypothetical protein SARC_05109 [Sphaeroforma arctica JP610]KNC82612.1 hypothetical protein SARC_05109 [Sphaeroforma arctica JP610]|eukprot:XP_014156514.1 hypothetical protein SARC_05109 [Sphaeroforma arctica JP610]
MRDNKHRLDVVQAMCRYCEEKQCDGSVGYGSHPDTDGHVTLDAMVMDGPGVRVGSVGALYGVRNAIGVARAVMEHTRHSLLVGSGAKRFARMMGFEKKSTETSASTGQFLDWMDKRCQPNFYINMQGNAQQWSCGPYTPNQPSANSLEQILSIVATDLTVAEDKPEETRDVAVSGHDTIAAITLDAEGHLACATTTNGPGHKVAGRVGDSPIAGSGCYVEEGAGGAGATGDGDVMLRFLPSFHAVQLMKHGASPTEACEQALKKIGHVYPDFSGGMVCVNKQGEIGAASHNMNFQYTTATLGDEDPTVVHVPNLLSAMELLEAH